MKYYLAPTIGSGTEQDSYRPKVSNYNCSWVAIYETPEQNNAIVAVKATDEVLAQITSDSEITYLGDDGDAMTTEEFQRICPDGKVMVYG
jgi:hypothetical protein